MQNLKFYFILMIGGYFLLPKKYKKKIKKIIERKLENV